MTILRKIFETANLEPKKLAVRIVSYVGDASVSRTYEELASRIVDVGSGLSRRFSKGDRVVLVFPTSIEFVEVFLGCIYAGLLPVPTAHVRGSNIDSVPARRFKSICLDCDPAVVVSDSTSSEIVDVILKSFSDVFNLSVDELTQMPPAVGNWKKSEYAFIQYTSGSTSTPKGILISHENLLANERSIATAFGHTRETIVAGWLPIHHDMGLIGNLLQPLFVGGSCHLMKADEFVQKPIRWLRLIEATGATTSGAPNFGYAHCVRKIKAEDDVDLSSWRLAFNGAERIDMQTVLLFSKRFSRCGFRTEAFFPCYGLAEATLFVSGGRVPEPEVHSTIEVDVRTELPCPVGRVCDQEADIRIIENDRDVTNEMRKGEIVVSSESCVHEYTGRNRANSRLREISIEGRPFLRTKDLGIVCGGELYVLGRSDNMMKIRGIFYEAEAMEAHLHSKLSEIEGVLTVVVMKNPSRSVQSPIVLVETDRAVFKDDVSGSAIASLVRTHLSKFCGIVPDQVMLFPGLTLPRTTSGKLKRSECESRISEGYRGRMKQYKGM